MKYHRDIFEISERAMKRDRIPPWMWRQIVTLIAVGVGVGLALALSWALGGI